MNSNVCVDIESISLLCDVMINPDMDQDLRFRAKASLIRLLSSDKLAPLADITEDFGQWLRKARRGLDLHQAELAKLAGISRSAIANYERGAIPTKQNRSMLIETLNELSGGRLNNGLD